MPDHPGALAHLERLFAAERDSRLESMEQAVLRLGTASGEAGRRAAIEDLSRHCHALKGAAQLEARVELCVLVDMLEQRAVRVAANTPDHSQVDLLLRAIAALHLVSGGDVADPLVSEVITELDPTVGEPGDSGPAMTGAAPAGRGRWWVERTAGTRAEGGHPSIDSPRTAEATH